MNAYLVYEKKFLDGKFLSAHLKKFQITCWQFNVKKLVYYNGFFLAISERLHSDGTKILGLRPFNCIFLLSWRGKKSRNVG